MSSMRASGLSSNERSAGAGQPARRMIASAAVACSSRVASAASSGMLPT
jgi:hypothetical protein